MNLSILLLTVFVLSSCTHVSQVELPKGSIDREKVRLAVKANLLEFKVCYDSLNKKNPEVTEGKIVIVWEIHDNGEAKNAKIEPTKTSIKDDEMINCMLNTMLKIKFPLPSKGTVAEITYPFLFQRQKTN